MKHDYHPCFFVFSKARSNGDSSIIYPFFLCSASKARGDEALATGATTTKVSNATDKSNIFSWHNRSYRDDNPTEDCAPLLPSSGVKSSGPKKYADTQFS